MARIRTIKPEVTTDLKLASRSRHARLTFFYLICRADDHGLIPARPRQLLGELYPHDEDITEQVLLAEVAELESSGMVRWRETRDGQPILEIVNWQRHQKVDHPHQPRLRDSLIPLTESFSRELREPLANISRDGREPTLDLGAGTEDHGPTAEGPPTNSTAKRKPRASRATRETDRVSATSSWVDEAVKRWAQWVGIVPHGRMGKELAPAVKVYGEAAVLAAISSFGEWRRDKLADFGDKVPGLPHFVANLRSYIPHNLLGDARPDGAESELLQPAAAAWESVYGLGSFDRNTAARELAPIHAAGLSPDQIARRLAFYLAQKGSETVLPADQLARRHFTPSLRDFRQRHAAFDPDALEAA